MSQTKPYTNPANEEKLGLTITITMCKYTQAIELLEKLKQKAAPGNQGLNEIELGSIITLQWLLERGTPKDICKILQE